MWGNWKFIFNQWLPILKKMLIHDQEVITHIFTCTGVEYLRFKNIIYIIYNISYCFILVLKPHKIETKI